MTKVTNSPASSPAGSPAWAITGSGESVSTATLSLQVGASADDGQLYDDGTGTYDFTEIDSSIAIGSTDMMMMGAADNTAFARFTGVTLAQGAVIVSATLQYKLYQSYSSGSESFYIKAHDANNSSAPTDESSMSTQQGALTSASTQVTLANDSDTTSFQDFPAVTSIVQEVVDRASWASGNAITFHFVDPSDAGSMADWEVHLTAYDNGALDGLKLVIVYES